MKSLFLEAPGREVHKPNFITCGKGTMLRDVSVVRGYVAIGTGYVAIGTGCAAGGRACGTWYGCLRYGGDV